MRLAFWKKSIEFIAAAPLLGPGTGTIKALFQRKASNESGTSAVITGNPHNQILAVAIPLGTNGAVVLIAMWIAHLALFRDATSMSWFGVIVVVSNVVSSLFNTHLFDFTQGWLSVFRVGIIACVRGGPPANSAGGGLAGGALAGRERGEPAIEFVDIELLRVEVAAAPFEQFRATLVLWIRDGVQELAVAPGTADVLGRTTPGALYDAWIDDTLNRRGDGFQHDHAAPAVAVVIKILEGALAIDDQRREFDLAPIIHLAIL